MSSHGLPCWYELASDNVDAAKAFYAGLLGWSWTDSGMPGMTYLLASAGETMVAGLFKADPGMPAAWQTYFAVDNADTTAAEATALGATVIVPPTDIPGTGRFSVMIDPQGAAFAILQPSPDGESGAFDQQKMGHGNWHELVTADTGTALTFYGKLFGWTISRSMPMGPDSSYHIIARGGVDIGGCFAMAGAAPFWKPYFGTPSANAAKASVTALGGHVLHGPDEVPGGAFTLQITDPQGVTFALVGPA